MYVVRARMTLEDAEALAKGCARVVGKPYSVLNDTGRKRGHYVVDQAVEGAILVAQTDTED